MIDSPDSFKTFNSETKQCCVARRCTRVPLLFLLVIFLLAKPIKNRQYCAHICTCAIKDKQHSCDIALAAGVISLIM